MLSAKTMKQCSGYAMRSNAGKQSVQAGQPGAFRSKTSRSNRTKGLILDSSRQNCSSARHVHGFFCLFSLRDEFPPNQVINHNNACFDLLNRAMISIDPAWKQRWRNLAHVPEFIISLAIQRHGNDNSQFAAQTQRDLLRFFERNIRVQILPS